MTSRIAQLADLPSVPPAIPMIFDEIGRFSSFGEVRQRVRSMLPDLRDQSAVFERCNVDRLKEARGAHFDIHLHGALDLLGSDGCQHFECRLKAANHVAQSFGLVADRIWLTDTISQNILSLSRATNARLDKIISDVMVMAQLLPLIAAGIVRFRSPWVPACTACIAEFEAQVERTAKEVAQVFRADLRLKKRRGGSYFAETGTCFDPPIYLEYLPKAHPSSRTFAAEIITRTVNSAFWVAREASLTGAAIASNSRAGLAGLLQREGRLLNRRSLLLMDREREFSVPWVDQLNAGQIMQLRSEASSALPAFRERIAKAMKASDADTSSPASIITELREEAIEVRAELEVKRKSSAKFWKVTYGVLGLGLSAYGLATDQIAAGVGGILPMIQMLIGHKGGHGSEVAKLKSRPGFVMVKAQDILAHADQ